MKKIINRKSVILMSSGIFIIAVSQIFFCHFVELPDLTKGLFFGIGIGMLLLAIIFGKYRTAQ